MEADMNRNAILLITAVIFCCAQAYSSNEDAYKQAQEYQEYGEYEKAIKLYEKTLETDPDNIEAINQMGMCYKNLGKYEDAVLQFMRIINTDPKYSAAYSNLASTYEEKKMFKEASEYWYKRYKMDPDSKWGQRAQLKAKYCEYKTKAQEIKEDDVDGHNSLGDWCMSQELFDAAGYEFKKVLEIDAENATAKSNLKTLENRIVETGIKDANRYIEQGDYYKAQALVTDILSSYPVAQRKNDLNNVINRVRGEYWKEWNRVENIRKELSAKAGEIVDVDDKMRVYVSFINRETEPLLISYGYKWLGEKYWEINDKSVATDYFGKSLKYFDRIYKSDTSIMKYEAGFEVAGYNRNIFKKTFTSVKIYQDIMEKFPPNTEESMRARFELACTYKATKDFFKAEQHFKNLIQNGDTRSHHVYRAYMELGGMYQQDKQYEKAMKLYKIAMEMTSSEWIQRWGLMSIAQCYYEVKDYSKAIYYYDMVVRKYPNSFEAKDAERIRWQIREEHNIR